MSFLQWIDTFSCSLFNNNSILGRLSFLYIFRRLHTPPCVLFEADDPLCVLGFVKGFFSGLCCEIMRDARAYENDTLMVLAAQGVIDRLLDEESANVADLEEFIGKTISLRVEPDINPEHFDIVLL